MPNNCKDNLVVQECRLNIGLIENFRNKINLIKLFNF